jgi:hypothetical protein
MSTSRLPFTRSIWIPLFPFLGLRSMRCQSLASPSSSANRMVRSLLIAWESCSVAGLLGLHVLGPRRRTSAKRDTDSRASSMASRRCVPSGQWTRYCAISSSPSVMRRRVLPACRRRSACRPRRAVGRWRHGMEGYRQAWLAVISPART